RVDVEGEILLERDGRVDLNLRVFDLGDVDIEVRLARDVGGETRRVEQAEARRAAVDRFGLDQVESGGVVPCALGGRQCAVVAARVRVARGTRKIDRQGQG